MPSDQEILGWFDTEDPQVRYERESTATLLREFDGFDAEKAEKDAYKNAEFGHMLEFARQRLRGAALPDLKAWAMATAPSIFSRINRVIGRDEEADWYNRFAGAYAQAQAEIDQEGPVPWLRSAARGVAATLPEMVVAGQTMGPYGAIASAVSQEANQGITEGRDAGLSGGDLAKYVAAQGATEALPAIVMQRMGLGGLESAVGRQAGAKGAQGVWQAGKQALKDIALELPEELFTEGGHAGFREGFGVQPGAFTDPAQIGPTMGQTALQTVMLGGAVHTPQMIQAAMAEEGGSVTPPESPPYIPSRTEAKAAGAPKSVVRGGAQARAKWWQERVAKDQTVAQDLPVGSVGSVGVENADVDAAAGVVAGTSPVARQTMPADAPPPAAPQPPANVVEPSGQPGVGQGASAAPFDAPSVQPGPDPDTYQITYPDGKAEMVHGHKAMRDAMDAWWYTEARRQRSEPVQPAAPAKASETDDYDAAIAAAFAEEFGVPVAAEIPQPATSPVPEAERIMANQGLVWKEARKLAKSNPGIDVEDLAQEGQIALLNAARSFDETKGAKFSSYAAKAIRNGMLGAIQKEGRATEIPPGVQSTPYPAADIKEMEAAVGKLSQRDQDVLSGVYGLRGQEVQPLNVLAKKAGISPAAMSARKAKAEKRLAEVMKTGKPPVKRSDQTRQALASEWESFKKAMGTTPNMGLNGNQVIAAVKLTRAAVDHGITTFAEYVQEAVTQLGDTKAREFAPYLEAAWRQIRKFPGYDMVDDAGLVADVLGPAPEPVAAPVAPEAVPETPVPPVPPAPPTVGKPSTPGKPAGVTSIKNAWVKELRESRGRSEIASVGLGTFEAWLDEAAAKMDADADWMSDLITELKANPRAVDHVEHAGMQLHYRMMYNRYGDAVSALVAARDSGVDTRIVIAQARVDELDEAMNAFEGVVRKTGTLAGQALASRKIELFKDFTLAGLTRAATAARGGVAPSAAESAELKRMSDKVAELESQLAESQAAERAAVRIAEMAKAAEEAAKKRKKKPKAPPEILDGKTAKEWGTSAIQQRAKMLGIVIGSRKPDRLIQLINQVEGDLQDEAARIGADYRVYLELVKDTAPEIISIAQREADLQGVVWDNIGIGKPTQNYATRWELWNKRRSSGWFDKDTWDIGDITKAWQEEFSDILPDRDPDDALWELMQKEIPTNIYLNSKEVMEAASKRFNKNQDGWAEARPEHFDPLPWERVKAFAGESPKRRGTGVRKPREAGEEPSTPPAAPAPPKKLTKAEIAEQAATRARASVENFKEQVAEKWASMFRLGVISDPEAKAAEWKRVTDAALEVVRSHVALASAKASLSFAKFWEKMYASLGADADTFKPAFEEAWKTVRGEGKIPPPKVDAGDLRAIGRYARDLARRIVATGTTDRDAVVASVWDELKVISPDITRREAMDAISGYGDFQELPKDTVSKEVRRIKGELQQLAKIADLENAIARANEWLAGGMSQGEVADRLIIEGLLPKKTGKERREVLDVESELIQQVNELKKKIPVSIEGGGSSLRTALGAAKAAVRHQIRWLAKMEKAAARSALTPDAELIALRETRDELRKEYDKLFPRPPKSRKRTAEQREKAALKRIAEIEMQLQTKEFTQRELQSDGLRDDLQKQLDRANARLKAARKAAKEAETSAWEGEGGGLGVKPPLTEAQQIAKMLAALDKAIGATETELKSGKVGQPKERLTSDEVDEKRSVLSKLRRAKKRMQDAADPEAAEGRARKARTKSLKRQLAEWKRRRQDGEFDTRRAEPKLTKEQLDLKYEIEQEKKKFAAMRDKWRRDRYTRIEKVGDFIEQSIFFVKSLLSFADFMTGRQGAPSIFSNPIITARTVAPMLKAAVPGGYGKKAIFKLMEEIKDDPLYTVAIRAGLPLTEEGMPLTAQEEAFAGRWPEKFPVTAWANRAASAFLNKLRFDLFKLDVGLAAERGEVSNDVLKAIAKEIGVWTGRGGLWRFESAAHGAAAVLFSARYFTSTFQVLADPFTIPFRKDAEVRKTLARRYARAGLGLAAFISLVRFAAWAFWDDDDENRPEISIDPRSSDFMKLKLGNTRFPLLGGIGPSAVLIARILSGQSKSSTSKLVYDLRGDNVKPMQAVTMKEVLVDFGRSKLAPVVGQGVDWALGETMDVDDETGAKIKPSVGRSVARMVLPISGNDVYDIFKEWGLPRGAALSVLALSGFGGSTYGTDRKKVLGAVAEAIASREDPRRMKEPDRVAMERSIDAMAELGADYEEAATALTVRLRKRGYSSETAQAWRDRLKRRMRLQKVSENAYTPD